MRLLFLSAQLPGHLDWGGYSATARTLAERGHEVLWASGSEVVPLLEKESVPAFALNTTGWRWPPPPPIRAGPDADRRLFAEQRMRRALDQWLDVARVTAATVELSALAQEFQPDLILSEMFIAAAGLVAEQLDIPFVVIGWPAPGTNMGPQGHEAVINEARERLDALLAHFELRGLNWTQEGVPALRSPDLHLTYWSERWLGTAAAKPNRHVGGITATTATDGPSLAASAAMDAPVVLITLGTSFNDDPDFFIAAASAADQMGATPLIAMGKFHPGPNVSSLSDRLSGRLPTSARLYGMLDLPAVLPHVSAAIHHGGAGTTHALVTHGVPQIVVPHAADQQQQAQGVARTGVGFHMAPRQAHSENLIAALAQLLPDQSAYRGRAEKLRQEFVELGGVPRAADIIEESLHQPV